MATPTIASGPTLTSATTTATCTTAVPGQYGHVPVDACNSNYAFNPSFSGNLAFAAIFGLTTLAHVVEAIAFKKKFCWVIIMGALWETVAFVIRTIGAHDQQQLTYAIIGEVMFLLAPLWINAFAYMTVARMVHFGLPDKKIWGIRAVKLTLIFVWLDVVCFIVQLGGGSLLSNNGDSNLIRIGQRVYMAGIGLQMAFIIIFTAMTLSFYRKMHQVTEGTMGRMRYLIWALLAVLALVVMRIIYRLVEFGPGVGSDNPIMSNEAYPLGLDAFPMALALIILNVMHPGLVLKGPDGEFPHLSRADKKAIKKEKKEAKLRRKEEKKYGRTSSDSIARSGDAVRQEPTEYMVAGYSRQSYEHPNEQRPVYGHGYAVSLRD